MKGPRVLAFEGIDGSGKETQCRLLREHLEASGCRVLVASYPQYGSFFGKEIGQLLSATNPMHSARTLDPKSMALWYALDRWAHFDSTSEQWAQAEFVLLNRSTMSSMVYQSLRSDHPEETLDWVEQLEFEVLHLPRPDLFVVFDVSPKSSAQNMKRKSQREYFDGELDVYEEDESLQIRSWKAYRQLANAREDSELVICENGQGELLDTGMVFERVLATLQSRSLL